MRQESILGLPIPPQRNQTRISSLKPVKATFSLSKIISGQATIQLRKYFQKTPVQVLQNIRVPQNVIWEAMGKILQI